MWLQWLLFAFPVDPFCRSPPMKLKTASTRRSPTPHAAQSKERGSGRGGVRRPHVLSD